jgi:uncharacterized membrane protein HdeD (DUF308 family)
MYSDQTSENKKEINLLIIFYPIGFFSLVLALGDYCAQYIINLFLLFLGITYLKNGLQAKDAIQLIIATLTIIASLTIRLEAIEEIFRERVISGIVIMIFGAIFAGIALYMRGKWTVTAPDENSDLDGNSTSRPIVPAPQLTATSPNEEE